MALSRRPRARTKCQLKRQSLLLIRSLRLTGSLSLQCDPDKHHPCHHLHVAHVSPFSRSLVLLSLAPVLRAQAWVELERALTSSSTRRWAITYLAQLHPLISQYLDRRSCSPGVRLTELWYAQSPGGRTSNRATTNERDGAGPCTIVECNLHTSCLSTVARLRRGRLAERWPEDAARSVEARARVASQRVGDHDDTLDEARRMGT